MKNLYQLKIYNKYHWLITGTICYLLMLIGIKIPNVDIIPRWSYFLVSLLFWIIQMVIIKGCELNDDIRKEEYKTGLRWLSLPVVLTFLIWWDFGN